MALKPGGAAGRKSGGRDPSRFAGGLLAYLVVTSLLLLLASLGYFIAVYGLHELAIYFLLFLPAMTANGSAVLARRIKAHIKGVTPDKVVLHRVDGGPGPGGRELLGAGKTWEGFFVGSLAGVIVGLVLMPGAPRVGIPYSLYLPVAAVTSVFALLGDMCGSFIKRSLGLRRGTLVPLLDQCDFYLGAFLGLELVGAPVGLGEAAAFFLVVYSLHVLTNCGAFLASLKEECP